MSKYKDNIHLEEQNNTTTQIFNSIKEKALVFDVGCASGYFAQLIGEKKGCTVIGLEINKKDAKIAENFCKFVLTDDIEGHDWEKKLKKYKFDHIIFADVLEHLKDPQRVLQRVKNFLKPDGTILVSIPNIAHISIRLELLKGQFVPEKTGILDDTHLKYFTKETFLSLARSAGFDVGKIAAYSFDFPGKWLINFLKELGLKPNQKALENFSSAEAVAYQYFFELVKSDKKPVVEVKENKPVYDVRKFLESVEFDHKKFKELYTIELEKLRKENRRLLSLNKKLNREQKEEFLSGGLKQIAKKLINLRRNVKNSNG